MDALDGLGAGPHLNRCRAKIAEPIALDQDHVHQCMTNGVRAALLARHCMPASRVQLRRIGAMRRSGMNEGGWTAQMQNIANSASNSDG